ncbi:MAG TPA: hypothetical protein VFS21_14465 [Roseiflexaceae bacterium]|nr:hypothetical protein [Roseiflexaceae bacterium]
MVARIARHCFAASIRAGTQVRRDALMIVASSRKCIARRIRFDDMTYVTLEAPSTSM